MRPLKKALYFFLLVAILLALVTTTVYAMSDERCVVAQRVEDVHFSEKFFRVQEDRGEAFTLHWDARSLFLLEGKPVLAELFFSKKEAPLGQRFLFFYSPTDSKLLIRAEQHPN